MPRKNVKNGAIKALRRCLATLSNEMTLRALPLAQVASQLQVVINETPKSDLGSTLAALLKRDRIAALFVPLKPELKHFGNNFSFATTAERHAVLLQVMFNNQRARLVHFETARRKYERSLLRGDFEAAQAAMDEIKEANGYSLWLIRSQLLLLATHGRLAEMDSFRESCRDAVTDEFMKTMVSWFHSIALEPLLPIRNTIAITIREQREGGVRYWPDLLTLMFIPSPLLERPRKLDCIGLIHQLPLIDRLVLAERYIGHSASLVHEAPAPSEYSGLTGAITSIRRKAIDELLATSSLEPIEEAVRQYETDSLPIGKAPFSSILSNWESLTAPVSLLAKSSAQTSVRPPLVAPLDQLVSAVADLYDVSRAPQRSLDQLIGAAAAYLHFSCAPDFQLPIVKACPAQSHPDDKAYLARLALNLDCTTTSFTRSLAAETYPQIGYRYQNDDADLPRHRVVKQKVRRLLTAKQPDASEVSGLLNEYRLAAPLAWDNLELEATSYLALGEMDKLLEMCASSLAQYPHAYTVLPIRDAVNYIEERKLSDINSLVITFFLTKYVDQQKEYLLNEIYEEFLERSQVRRPAELASICNDEKMTVVLRDISRLDTMDFLGCFEGSDDLRAERLTILDFLQATGRIAKDAHRAEVDEIVSNAVVDSGATEFNAHKIDVNDAALKRQLVQEIDPIFHAFQAARESTRGNKHRQKEDDKPKSTTLVAEDLEFLALKMFKTVRDAFLYDVKHGLDKNLSSEIRHGFFANLMRSRLEESHLITELDENNTYKFNSHWLSDDSLISRDFLLEINKCLMWFSEQFNTLVQKGEEWMKIADTGVATERVFNFTPADLDIEIFTQAALGVTSTDELVEFAINENWRVTEHFLAEMRQKIEVDFKREVNDLFQDLENRLHETRKGLPLIDLFAAISRARNGVNEDIATIAEWFHRNKSLAASRRSLSDLIDIALACHGRVRSSTLVATKTIPSSFKLVELDGRHVKAFLVALVNLFENCVRHSGSGLATPVDITGRDRANGWQILITNELTPDRMASFDRERLEYIRHRLVDPSAASFVRKEGGSGLLKARHELASISDDLNLSFALGKSNFTVEISYAPPSNR